MQAGDRVTSRNAAALRPEVINTFGLTPKLIDMVFGLIPHVINTLFGLTPGVINKVVWSNARRDEHGCLVYHPM